MHACVTPSLKQLYVAHVQGLVDRLIDNTDPTSRALLQRSTWYVVPNMNPDGNYLGYHRTNRNGINLNRAWGARTTADSPETAAVEVRVPCHQFALQKGGFLTDTV